MRWGRWWAVQWDRARLLELGVHVETRMQWTNDHVPFGPYVDIHLPGVTVSLGLNPIYAGELHLKDSRSRGGLSANSH